MIIRSSNALSDYSTISDPAHEKQEPIYITRNGEEDLVLMSVEAYERREQLFKLKSVLDERERNKLSGTPGISLEKARKRSEEKYADQTRDQTRSVG